MTPGTRFRRSQSRHRVKSPCVLCYLRVSMNEGSLECCDVRDLREHAGEMRQGPCTHLCPDEIAEQFSEKRTKREDVVY